MASVNVLPAISGAKNVRTGFAPGGKTQPQSQSRPSPQQATLARSGSKTPDAAAGSPQSKSRSIRRKEETQSHGHSRSQSAMGMTEGAGRTARKQEICLQLLIDGYPESYQEFFRLTHPRDAVVHVRREDDEGIPQTDDTSDELPLVIPETDLEFVRDRLVDAEEAKRIGDILSVYRAQEVLGRYFEEARSYSTAFRFRQSCLAIAELAADNGRLLGEANRNMGVAFMRQGKITEAVNYLESYYNLVVERNEKDASLLVDAGKQLINGYTLAAERIQHSDAEADEALDRYRRCVDIAESINDPQSLATSTFRLGKALERAGDPQAAVLHHENYYNMCVAAKDDQGEGQACIALASSHKALGDLDTAMSYLEKFIVLAERTSQAEAAAEACNQLGSICTTLGRREKAVEWFGKCYAIMRASNNSEGLNLAKVQYGIARANLILGAYKDCLQSHEPRDLGRLLNWKNMRVQTFAPEEAFTSSSGLTATNAFGQGKAGSNPTLAAQASASNVSQLSTHSATSLV